MIVAYVEGLWVETTGVVMRAAITSSQILVYLKIFSLSQNFLQNNTEIWRRKFPLGKFLGNIEIFSTKIFSAENLQMSVRKIATFSVLPTSTVPIHHFADEKST